MAVSNFAYLTLLFVVGVAKHKMASKTLPSQIDDLYEKQLESQK